MDLVRWGLEWIGERVAGAVVLAEVHVGRRSRGRRMWKIFSGVTGDVVVVRIQATVSSPQGIWKGIHQELEGNGVETISESGRDSERDSAGD